MNKFLLARSDDNKIIPLSEQEYLDDYNDPTIDDQDKWNVMVDDKELTIVFQGDYESFFCPEGMTVEWLEERYDIIFEIFNQIS